MGRRALVVAGSMRAASNVQAAPSALEAARIGRQA